MQVKRFRVDDHPDFSVFLVHFTYRLSTPNKEVPPRISKMSAEERLMSILRDQCIEAFPVWGNGPTPVVCFTECTKAGIESLLERGRYEAVGIAFRKDFVFEKDGGPAFYVRGDDWKDWKDLPAHIRARATRLWPGASPEEDETLPNYLRGESQWQVEREWRVLGSEDPPGFRFKLRDVTFLLLDESTGEFPDEWLDDDEEGLAKEIRRVPRLGVAGTSTIGDPAGIWLIHHGSEDPVAARRLVRLLTETTRYWRLVRVSVGATTSARSKLEKVMERYEARLDSIATAIQRGGGGSPRKLRQLALDRAACGCSDPLECPHLAALIDEAF